MKQPKYRKQDLENPHEVPPEFEVCPVPTEPATEWQTELTRPLLERLVACAATMAFRKHVSLACGVKPDLLEWWIAEGMRDDAPNMMMELSVRFQSAQAISNALIVNDVRRAAARGEWQAAVMLLSKRSPEWSGKLDVPEKDPAPPELSLRERQDVMKQALANPQRELEAALLEILKDPNSGLSKLVEKATKKLPEG